MKSKKRLICSICAVFLIAFSLFLIPFSKIDSASAEPIPTKSWSSETFSVNYGFVPQDWTNYPLISSTLSFSLSTSNTDSFYFDFYTLGFRKSNNTPPLQIEQGLGPYNTDTSIFSRISFSASDSGRFYTKYFCYGWFNSNSWDSTVVVDTWGYPYGLLYLQSSNTNQVFNGDVVSIEKGGFVNVPSSFDPTGIGFTAGTPFPLSLINNYSSDNIVLKYNYNWYRVYDSLGNSFVFFIPFWTSYQLYAMPSYWKHEVFYLNDLTDNQIYDEGYNTGYGVGSTEGYDTGYNTGYNEGFTNGENTGFGNGYVEGLETASETTFLGLIGATIDAPIKAFRGLFNFELLGVNMVSLITGLFTLCVIVCIVKLVLGGK